jgi:apolipoprotein N-acyltransferase
MPVESKNWNLSIASNERSSAHVVKLLLETALRVGHTEEAVPPAFTREELLAARLRVAKVLPYQRSASPFISNLMLAISSGLLLVFAFPEWNLWSLAWVGAAPLIMAITREQRFWRSLLLGTITGTIFYLGTSHWITYSMHNYAGVPLWLCYVASTLLAAILGSFTGLFAGVTSKAIARFGGWAILASPIVWAASEWARLRVTEMGWNSLGYCQAFQPAVIQIARLGGVYAVSALLTAANAALVFAIIYIEQRRGYFVLTAMGLLTIASLIYGHLLKPSSNEPATVTVAAIQPNIPIAGQWDDPEFIERMIARHLSLSEQVIAPGSPATAKSNNDDKLAAQEAGARETAAVSQSTDLVIWPESAMNFEYDRDPALQRKIAQFTRRNNVFLLMNSWGFPRDGGISNSALVIDPSGEKITEYDKIALLPFGEYVPARKWIPFMDRVKAIVGDITPGTSLTLSRIRGAKVGTLICFEAVNPDIARRMRQEGASALVQISNEAWFGQSAAARQMLAHAVFRAVENNCDLIRVTNSGLSARIDRYGAIEGLTPSFEVATRRWKIKTVEESQAAAITIYTRYGDAFAIGCVVLSLLLAVAAFTSHLEVGRKNKSK